MLGYKQIFYCDRIFSDSKPICLHIVNYHFEKK